MRPDKTDPTMDTQRNEHQIKAWQSQQKPKPPQTGILESALFPSSFCNGS